MRKLPIRPVFRVLVIVVGVVLLAGTPEARADFLFGKQLSVQVFSPNLNSPLGQPVIFTANGTNNVNLSGNVQGGFIVNVDLIVSDTTIEFIYQQTSGFTSAVFNGYVFNDVSPDIPAFTSLTVDPATTLANFGSSRISFTSNQIDVNVQGLFANVGIILKLDLVVASNVVPEPGSLVLLGMGLPSAAFLAWRRRFRVRAATV